VSANSNSKPLTRDEILVKRMPTIAPTKRTATRQDIIDKNEAVTVTEAAKHLAVSHKTIRRLIARGLLPAFRVAGGPIRVLASDVEGLKVPVRAS
jgi:excisionase family DNA binding protein